MAKITARELKKNISENNLQQVYLLCGDENYLVELYLKRLSDAVPDGGMPDFNRLVVEEAKGTIAEVMDFVQSYPLMSEKKLLVMHNSGVFKSATEEVKTFWTQLFSDVPEYLVIIFAERELDKKSAIYKAICKVGAVAEFERLSPTDTITWIERQALEAKKKITKDNAAYLAEVCNIGMDSLKSEVDKLIDFCDEEITRTDIDRLVSKSLNVKIFEMTDAIMLHNADKALGILSDMKTVKESAYNILFTIFQTFDKMLYASLLLREGESVDRIAARLGVPPYIARKYMKKSFDDDFLIDCVCAAAEIDLAIKNGECDDWTALEQFVTDMFNKKNKR